MLPKKFFLVAMLAVLLVSCGILLYRSGTGMPPFSGLVEKPPHYDLLIKNAEIIDGSGGRIFQGDVAVAGDYIEKVGRFRATADLEIDARGLAVSPGFINPHSHIDQTIAKDPEAQASLLQGVTTEIVGVDGRSAADLEKHFAEVSHEEIGINYGSLVGQGSVRQAVLGSDSRTATQSEITAMQAMVKKAMEQGAFGLSTGLAYLPGTYTSTEEIIRLAQAAAPFKGVYVSHIRNESDRVISAVKEALDIGKGARIPVVISHIKISSSINDPSREEVIARNTETMIKTISAYQKSGGQVYADLYPYRVSFFLINRRLEEVLWRYPLDNILISAGSKQGHLGKTITEIAEEEDAEPGVIAQRLAGDPQTKVCVNNLSEASLRQLLQADFTMIGMDNVVYWPDPSYLPPAHPRNYGTYPKILGEYVREEGVLPLEKAVHKMTGLTAQVYGIQKRGFIREGYFADLVVFDPQTIRDRATYWEPNRPPQGVMYVIVNGKPAVSKGDNKPGNPGARVLTGIRNGKIIRHGKSFSQHP